VLGIADAEHAEEHPGAGTLVITAVSCPVPNRSAGAPNLSGTMTLRIRDRSKAREILGQSEIEEEYFCNFELNPEYRPQFESAGLAFTGEGLGGEARIFELSSHPFFLGTLFQPQRGSTSRRPHPLIVAFARAALAR
jgi:CTP synthase (UTP-ammonia lyase)